jgi:hypothetical protein
MDYGADVCNRAHIIARSPEFSTRDRLPAAAVLRPEQRADDAHVGDGILDAPGQSDLAAHGAGIRLAWSRYWSPSGRVSVRMPVPVSDEQSSISIRVVAA